jgi:isoleucyl-tRNA synthetase
VLDRWLLASAADLARFVRAEMAAYRLYTVVPRLMTFIGELTNVYVRFNRGRLKGRDGGAGGDGDGGDDGGDAAAASTADRLAALSTLHTALCSLAVAMAPFTPFLCETMWRNLRRALPPDATPASVHWAPFPDPPPDSPADADVRAGVSVVVRAIELARTVRERSGRPLRQPLARLTLVTPDPATLALLTPDLRRYILAEANVRELEASTDVKAWCATRLVPDWPALGKRLGRALPAVKRALADADGDLVASIERGEAVTVGGVELEAGAIKVQRSFAPTPPPDKARLDGDGDGDLFVALDLTVDADLAAAGTARDVATRVQKARKTAGLVAGEPVRVWLGGVGGGALPAALADALAAQADWVAASLGAPPRGLADLPAGADEMLRETHAVGGAEFELVLTRV